MSSLKQYIKENEEKIQKINESVDNNIYLINEEQFVIEYGKEIDNLLNKFGKYTYNNIYNPNYIQESSNNKLSLNESEAAKNLLVFVCEDYKRTLLQELNIYENLLNDNEDILNESLLNEGIIDNIKNTWKQGKDKVKQAYENIKTKIKEVNELIKDFATKSIKTIKDMAAKLISLLEKFNCTIKDLFTKMGFDADKEEESVNKIADELAKNPEILKKNDAYDFKSETNESFEEYGRYLKQINEDDNQAPNQKNDAEDEIENNGETVKQAEKKSTKQMLWSAFKQFIIWSGVCIVIPGIVCAAFPGTFIALLVPLACKLAWNGYKIVKIWKQWQKVKKEWHTYSKVQKWITVIGMIASIIALAINFNSLIGDSGKILSAFKDNGCNLLAKANIGVQPDALTRGFAAFVKMISEGKFSMDDFGSAFKEITDSFAEKTDLGAGVGAAIEKTIKGSGKLGQTAKEAAEKIKEINDATHGSSMAELKAIEKISIGVDKIKDAPDNTMVDLVVNGTKESSYGKHLINFLKKTGIDTSTNDLLNKSLQKLNKLAGSVYTIRVPKDEALEILNNSAKYAKDGFIYAVSATAEEVTNNIPEIIDAASSMVMTIPSVEYAFQNNGGFQVRLGTDKKKYVYEVGKDGVKKEEAADHIKEVEKITNIIKETNNKYYKELKDKLKEEDGDKKKEIEEKLKTFQKNFEKINNRSDVIIFYGNKVKNQNESLKSLHDYLIYESEEDTKKSKYSIDDIKKNFTDLRDYLKKIGREYDDKHKDDKDYKNGFKGNCEISLLSFFSLKDKDYAKWEFDNDWEQDPYKVVKDRLHDDDKENDKFGKQDLELLALSLTIINEKNNEDTYNSFCEAFKAVIILRKLLKESQDINDNIKATYVSMVDNLKNINSINTDIKDKEWKPGEEWAPIKFNEDKISDKAKDNVENTEDNIQIPSKDEAEKDLEKIDAVLPDEGDKKSEEDKKSKETDNENTPILMIAYNYVIDLSDSDDNGPRKDVFTLKNIDENYEFTEIKGGTSKENISIMLGDILKTQTEYLRGFTILNPCDDKDSDNFKTIGDENTEREDFGKLTNGEITDIMNKPKKAKKYIFGNKSNKVTAAETEKEKETEEERAKKNVEAIKKDEKALQAAKKINPNISDDDGNINDKELEKTSQELATWQLGKHKNKTKKGFWNKIKSAFKSIFGSSENDEKYSELNHIIANESLIFNNNFDLFEELEIPKYKSLKDYILEKQNN